jgi:DNA polymerase III alpha subunit (gram-positive type)
MKQYIFIDLEAADKYSRASVCCFGVVVCDEEFKIEEKKTVLIKPSGSFNINGKSTGLDIGFTKSDFHDKPNFKETYPELKKYLNKENLIFGHAIDNDLRMLIATCNKYHLPHFEFSFIDTQSLYQYFKQDETKKSLNKIAEEINAPLTHHLAEEDALMSYLTLQRIKSSKNLKTLPQLLSFYEITCGSTKNGQVLEMHSPLNPIRLKKSE